MPMTTTFLLVEDDANDALLVEEEFKHAPHLRVHHVSDGQEAMHYLTGESPYRDRDKYPLPDVILLDLKMPGISGFDFLEWLNTEAPKDHHLIPVVVMSSSSLQEDVKRAYEMGVNAYMCKPIDWETFRQRIKALGVYWSEHAETPEMPQ